MLRLSLIHILLDGTLDSRGAVRAGVPVLYFPFPVEYPEDDTQAVLERLLPDCPAWRILRELNLLGVEQDVLYLSLIHILADLKIQPGDKISAMSKGTREKVQLVLVMSRAAGLYLLDEPIGGVDPCLLYTSRCV